MSCFILASIPRFWTEKPVATIFLKVIFYSSLKLAIWALLISLSFSRHDAMIWFARVAIILFDHAKISSSLILSDKTDSIGIYTSMSIWNYTSIASAGERVINKPRLVSIRNGQQVARYLILTALRSVRSESLFWV